MEPVTDWLGKVADCLREMRLIEPALRLAKIGAWECDLETEQLTWTDGVYRLFDLSPGPPVQRCATLDMYFEESRRQLETVRAEAIRCRRPFELDVQVRTAESESRWIRISADVASEDDRAVRLFGVKQDITRDRNEWSRLRRMAEHDSMTGLANRSQFDARYHNIVTDELNHGFASALVLVDIDRFKQINDTLGHAAGDECLREVAMRLQRAFRNAALIARIGGDEFAVFLRSPLGVDRLAYLLKRASGLLCKPLFWNETRIELGASIGAAMLTKLPSRKRSDLFERADAALYKAKAGGGNGFRIDAGLSQMLPISFPPPAFAL